VRLVSSEVWSHIEAANSCFGLSRLSLAAIHRGPVTTMVRMKIGDERMRAERTTTP
jgi:hypothetical protein